MRQKRKVVYPFAISQELDKAIQEKFPAKEGWNWERVLWSLLGVEEPEIKELEKDSCLDEIRKACKHPQEYRSTKTGLYPNPEEVWQWCNNCQLLIGRPA